MTIFVFFLSWVQCCGAGTGIFCRSRLKSTGSGLLLCDLGVLWWQSCYNSYNVSQILTVFTQIERQNRYTLKKRKMIYFIFNFIPIRSPNQRWSWTHEPEPGQDWTGSTTLVGLPVLGWLCLLCLSTVETGRCNNCSCWLNFAEYFPKLGILLQKLLAFQFDKSGKLKIYLLC